MIDAPREKKYLASPFAEKSNVNLFSWPLHTFVGPPDTQPCLDTTEVVACVGNEQFLTMLSVLVLDFLCN